MKKSSLLIAALFAIVVNAAGQGAFDYNDIATGRFAQKSVSGLRSMDDGEHYTVVDDGVILKYSYATGELVDTLCNVYRQIEKGASFYDYELSADESKILLKLNSKPLYRRSAYSRYEVYDINTKNIIPVSLSRDADQVRYAAFDPQGGRVAFVLNNNIYISNLDGSPEMQVTHDGEFNHIINGVPDWAYEEEFGLYHALRWSPQGDKIAFLRFDESEVREYPINYFMGGDEVARQEYSAGNLAAPIYPSTYTYKYPKAGEKNSEVSLHVLNLAAGKILKVVTYFEEEDYIPHFDWTSSSELYFYTLNRLQNHFKVKLISFEKKGTGGGYKIIYEEKADTYIDNVDPGTITFLPDSKKFIVRSETVTGYNHLYMHSIDKGLMYPITSGEWEVKEVLEVSDKNIWFTSNEGSPLRTNLWSVDLKGKKKARLTTNEGTYRISPSKHFKYYISYFSNVSTPNIVTLHKGDGRLVRTLEDNAALRNYISSVRLPKKEFFMWRTAVDGQEIAFNCYMVRPESFDPGRKYPVMLTQYSGPGSQQVLDRWNIDWEDALVQQGYIVVCMDGRGTGGRGEKFKKCTYGRLGELETVDQIAFAQEMASRPFVDPSRIGIYGWSYGGFMSLNCILKGADTFKLAISVAPVTSWRLYDSIYTERFNGMPQDNPSGYDDPSPITHAAKLEGRLLIMHGSGDDNVHVQNSYKMAYELVKAGKHFDMMIYPDDNHSMMPRGRTNVRQKMVDYCVDNL